MKTEGKYRCIMSAWAWASAAQRSGVAALSPKRCLNDAQSRRKNSRCSMHSIDDDGGKACHE
jgi:hypothetical protein